MKTDLTVEEKQQFLKDGFIIIRNAVSEEAVAQARLAQLEEAREAVKLAGGMTA